MKKLFIYIFILFVFIPYFQLLKTNSNAFTGFSDVPNSSPYYEATKYVGYEGLISGYSDGTFRPESPITRGEFVKMVMVMKFDEDAYHESCGYLPYSDLTKANKFARYICGASKMDIVGGYSDKTFRVDEFIEAGQGLKIIAIAFGYSDKVTLSAPVGHKFKPYIDSLDGLNAIPLDISYLDSKLTRGQVAEILYRILDSSLLKETKTYTDLLPNKCSWCGMNCTQTFPEQACPMVMPAPGLDCITNISDAGSISCSMEKCSPEGEFSTRVSLPVESGTPCCMGLEETNPGNSFGYKLCYNPYSGVPICRKNGPQGEGWYYKNGTILKLQNCPEVYDSYADIGEMCGGIAGIECGPQLECLMEGNYPDASGRCVFELE